MQKVDDFWTAETKIQFDILERLPPMLKFFVEVKNKIITQQTERAQKGQKKEGVNSL